LRVLFYLKLNPQLSRTSPFILFGEVRDGFEGFGLGY